MTDRVRFIAVALFCFVLLGVTAAPVLAWRNDHSRGWDSSRGRYQQHHRTAPYGTGRSYGTYYGHSHSSHNGEAVVLGIVGGLVGLAILDQILTPPRVVYAEPPPPSGSFGAGYSDGYRRGYDRAQRDLYRDGRARGYEDGYREGRY